MLKVRVSPAQNFNTGCGCVVWTSSLVVLSDTLFVRALDEQESVQHVLSISLAVSDMICFLRVRAGQRRLEELETDFQAEAAAEREQFRQVCFLLNHNLS
jgi:hypothetical protein